jgi:hypothetical protein
MPNTDAAEIQVVLKDGNVMRVIGVAAEELWDGMMRADGEYLTTPTATKSKPLRKVTEIHGSYSSLNDEIIDDDGCTLFGITLRDLMPEACTSRRAKIRITVESVEDVDR